MEEKVAKLEGFMEQTIQRLDRVETEISELRSEIGGLRDRVEVDVFAKLRNKIDSNFKWTLGILITMWITIILTVLLKK